jgi:ABC-type polysaccharide/polyol phosphate transport system ATPase subunit
MKGLTFPLLLGLPSRGKLVNQDDRILGWDVFPPTSVREMSGCTPSPEEAPSQIILEMREVSLQIPVFTTEMRSLGASLLRSVTGGILRRQGQGALVEALRDINLTVRYGERIALIGHNGAGKSTFLRLISGIYKPSSGRMMVRTFVYPMINKSFVTSDDLSGLQAVKAHYLMLNGTMHGFAEFLEDVVDFSGLGDYIHLPVKGYSQGMVARLLFAVLTGITHDCLALDEGIGAGDQRFVDAAQKRLDAFIAKAGTLFLASHSTDLLRRFCRRGLVFDGGRIVCDLPLEDALAYYRGHLIGPDSCR